MKYLIVFIVFLSCISVAQDTPSFEEQVEVEGQEPQVAPVETAPESPPAEVALPTNSGTEASGINDSSDFDVFQPSEDISEDLSVPFPADI